MIVLGIETSCDETAVALVRDGRELMASAVASSAEIHRAFGGVVPEIASRMHVESILPVLSQCLKRAECTLNEVDAIAVTYGPGLAGALLVGLSTAKALAQLLQKPLLGVHHIASHIAANYLAEPTLKPPFICLVASGGHSQIIEVASPMRLKILATTRDDAAGEALDKVARAVGLPYPGGPQLDQLAKQGNPTCIRFPQTRFPNDSLDFSFSGVKTAALTYLQKTRQQAERQQLDWKTVFPLADFCAAYQEAILTPLVQHAQEALERTGYSVLTLAGGVSANSRLRQLCQEMTAQRGVSLIVPPLKYCTDNAAMVAAMGYYVYLENPKGRDLDLDANPQLTLSTFIEEVGGGQS